jgi:hypothetical protein
MSHSGCDGDFGLPAFAELIALMGVCRNQFQGDFAVCGKFECQPDSGCCSGPEHIDQSAAGDFVAWLWDGGAVGAMSQQQFG